MKIILFLLVSASLFLGSCRKTEMVNDSGLIIKNYESKLDVDYTNASLSHKALTGISSDSHLAHHPGTKVYSSSNQVILFNMNDSLFSEHFYEFCVEMMKDEDHMSSNGMMGNSGMMGSDATMMNVTHNMDEMTEFMESEHNAGSSMMGLDYFKADSLLYAKMSECKMMTNQTEGISTVFNKMQALRMEHRSLHDNFRKY